MFEDPGSGMFQEHKIDHPKLYLAKLVINPAIEGIPY
jgi:hypothetical protein